MGFADELGRIVLKFERDMGQVVAKTCLELSGDIIMDTPVLFGRARANWFPAVGQPSRETTTDTDKGGQAAVQRVQGAVDSLKAGDTFVLSNHLDYILSLEHGSSQKAPQGMVRRNTKRFTNIVCGAVRGLK